MKVTFHAAAELDVADAAAFYERSGSPVVAAKFIAEFKRTCKLLQQFPELGSPRSHGRRGFSMSITPYTVIYPPESDGIFVLVVKHDSRHPGYGGSRRPPRGMFLVSLTVSPTAPPPTKPSRTGAALKETIAALREAGHPVPEPTIATTASGRFVARVPKSVHARLTSRAKAEGVSLNTLVVSLPSQGLGKKPARA